MKTRKTTEKDYVEILDFMTKYYDLAPNNKNKKINLARFSEIGLNINKVRVHLSLDRYYFLTQVSDDVEYYKSYIRLNKNSSMEFNRKGHYHDDKHILQFGYHKVRVPDNNTTNFFLAQMEIIGENRISLKNKQKI